jgi:SET domain-containing protein 6
VKFLTLICISFSNDAYTVVFSRFNHKTGAEDVHFTALSSNDESDDDDVVDGFDEGIVDEEALAQNGAMDKTENGIISDMEYSSVTEDDTSMLEMVMIKDVSSGVEVRRFLLTTWSFFNFH